jgi:hypothetical protein
MGQIASGSNVPRLFRQPSALDFTRQCKDLQSGSEVTNTSPNSEYLNIVL